MLMTKNGNNDVSKDSPSNSQSSKEKFLDYAYAEF